MATTTNRLRRPQQVERNREVVLEAARHVFLERGYGGATLEAIADEAGFSKGVVYSQFGSKADMFLALLERRIDERGAQNERIAAEAQGLGAVRELLLAAGRDAAAERGWATLLVEFRAVASRDPEINRRYAAAHDRSVGRLANVLGGIFDRSGVQPPVSARSIAEFVFAIGSGIALERAADPDALNEQELQVLIFRALDVAVDNES